MYIQEICKLLVKGYDGAMDMCQVGGRVIPGFESPRPQKAVKLLRW